MAIVRTKTSAMISQTTAAPRPTVKISSVRSSKSVLAMKLQVGIDVNVNKAIQGTARHARVPISASRVRILVDSAKNARISLLLIIKASPRVPINASAREVYRKGFKIWLVL